MDIAIIVLALTCAANISLGLFIFLRNSSSATSRCFFILSILISCWALANYFTDKASLLSLNILFNKLSFLFGFLALMASLVFSYLFTGRKIRYQTPLIVATVVISILSITNLVSGNVQNPNGQLVFTSGHLIWIYILAVVFGFGIILHNLYKLAKTGDTNQKKHARIIASCFGASIILGMLTNVIIPLFSDSFQTTKYGPPILSVCLVGGIGYAIIRHRLFDIRPIVARSFAYVLSLIFIGAVYAAAAFGINQYFFSGSSVKTGQEIFYLLLALLTALIFPSIKSQFDRLTNSIFYRDAYDPQAFLDELNTVLVTTMNLKDLLWQSSRIINKYLKSEFASFSIVDSHKKSVEIHGMHHLELAHDYINHLNKTLSPNKTTVLQITTMDNTGELYDLSQRYSIAAVVNLVTKEEAVGYLLFGQKKSGNVYSSQDEKTMEIIGEELAIAIQNSLRFEEIQKFNLTLQERIEEATIKLRKANRRLKELDQTKDEFISIASHQLRTPLTAIKGYLSMILEGDTGPIKKDQQPLIEKAFESAENMVDLIADLLNVSRLQSGKFVLENRPTQLAAMVDAEVKRLSEQAAARNIQLAFQKPSDTPILNIDATKIRQVVMNFLDNSLYYTPKGGQVTVELKTTPETVTYTVTDTGVGVPKVAQHHLFSKFYRADNAKKMRPDGTGLGLFMAKKVIVAQGGAIIFKSEEGKGSTFGFSFPRSTTENKS